MEITAIFSILDKHLSESDVGHSLPVKSAQPEHLWDSICPACFGII